MANDSRPTRRSFMKTAPALIAAPAAAAGFASFALSDSALASAKQSNADSDSDEHHRGEKIWSNQYWAMRGDTKLFMFRKRLGAPHPAETPMPVLFLVHGSSISSVNSFDLKMPGHGEYSLMDDSAATDTTCGRWISRATDARTRAAAIQILQMVSRI